MSEEEVGPTCLYKDGDAQVFEGEKVAEAMAEGWSDNPNGAPSEPAPEPEPEATEAP